MPTYIFKEDFVSAYITISIKADNLEEAKQKYEDTDYDMNEVYEEATRDPNLVAIEKDDEELEVIIPVKIDVSKIDLEMAKESFKRLNFDWLEVI